MKSKHIAIYAAVLAACAGLCAGQPSALTSTVGLAWNPVAGATSYNLWWGTASGTYTTNVATTNTSVTLTNLARGLQYYFAATASANGVTSAYSAEVSCFSFSIPQSPTGVTVVIH